MDEETSAADSLLRGVFRRQGYQSQNISNGGVVDYWGYAGRVVPCTNDAGTCEYFESVYGGHERGMLYTGIIWATLGGILFVWAIGRHIWGPPSGAEAVVVSTITKFASGEERRRPNAESPGAGGLRRLRAAATATCRYYTLPESMRFVFGRTTRLQVLILAMLTIYLAIFSFIGIWYKDWMTPVKGYDNLYQRRSWLGAWSDRVGTLAYALTPFSILLASRESILSLLTGVPYQSFNFLHRWLGWIIAIQALAHTIGWTIIESVFYQPQPQVANKWIKQLYMIWGCVASIILFLLVILATPWGVRLTGYEFFRKSHYVLAMIYIGACWGHWQPLKVFMVPGLAIWLVDRGARLMRSFLIHYQYLPDGTMGFQAAPAKMTFMPDAQYGDIVRLDFSQPHDVWKPGQHFYICFAKSSVWQSHPFTPLNFPTERNGVVEHAYIFRAKKGETGKVAQMAAAGTTTTPVILQGPYGEDHTLHLLPDANVLCIAGGTGITYVLPILHWLIRQPANPNRRIALVWAVRLRQDLEWVRAELDALADAKGHGISITIHITREEGESLTSGVTEKDAIDRAQSSSSRSSSSRANGPVKALEIRGSGSHPRMADVVPGFLSNNVQGRTAVFASGPGAMISDLRGCVAAANSGGQIWKGNEMVDVELICDNRLEW
ncbi:Ferric/cupric reductase transmembrane component 2 [Colletotrichum sp. SAR 10_98]|nr:Ferric/cupric reductase transmembrane component 2 [Colletotrichum sp. SAR 10_98]